MEQREFETVDGILPAVFRVLDDGRLQLENDEGSWTLTLAQSYAVARLILGEV